MLTRKNFHKISIFLFLTLCLFYILLIRATLNAAEQYNRLQTFTNTFFDCQKADAQLAAGSDYLTDQVRTYVVTQDEQYMENYFAEAEKNRRRERAINDLAAYEAKNASYDYLMATLDASNLLMQREFYAMKLTALAQGIAVDELPESLQNTMITTEDQLLSPQEMLSKAQDLVFNERYNLTRSTINKKLEYAISSLLSVTTQEQQNARQALQRTMREQAVLIGVLFIENILLLALYIAAMHRRGTDQPSKKPSA